MGRSEEAVRDVEMPVEPPFSLYRIHVAAGQRNSNPTLPAVDVWHTDLDGRRLSGGDTLTTDQARNLAAALIQAADQADAAFPGLSRAERNR